MKRTKVIRKVIYFSLSFLFLSVFYYLFSKSFESSPDGESYLTIFSRRNMFEGREEIGFLAYSLLLKEIFGNERISMYVTISISLYLFLHSCYRYFNGFDLLKLSLALFSIVTIFSNSFGVQIRAGFASFLLVAIMILFFTKSQFKKWQLIFLLTPVLFHYNAAASSLLAFSLFLVPARWRKVVLVSFISGIILLAKPLFYLFAEDNAYYLVYVTGEDLGRTLPFTLLFYIVLVLIISIVSYKSRNQLTIIELFSLSGIGLLVLFFQDFYIASKMLEPFRVMAYICVIRYIDLIRLPDKHKEIIGFMVYLISFAGFFYYANQIFYEI